MAAVDGTLGVEVTKDSLASRLVQIAANAAQLMDDIEDLANWAGAKQDADLLKIKDRNGVAITADDVAQFRTFVGDANNWRLTTLGQRAQSPASNFMFNIYTVLAFTR